MSEENINNEIGPAAMSLLFEGSGKKSVSSENETEFDQDEELDLEEEVSTVQNAFNPADIDIEAKQMSLDTLIKRMEYEDIDLQPNFQRNQNLWKPDIKSRLIESLLVRFPLPAFYFDATNDDKWQVVDGLQRLSTIKQFVLDNKLVLKNLDFLKQCEGSTYSDLSRSLQRRIQETQITAYLIKPRTPDAVKYSLFHRINTGGLQLKPQEIRHAISQGINDGRASAFLNRIAESEIFKKVGRVSGTRMLHHELILRHVALKLAGYEKYRAPMITFLDEAMTTLGNLDEKKGKCIETELLQALQLSYDIFGEDAFRKSLIDNTKQRVINRALFEAVSVLFSNLNDKDREELFRQKSEFLVEFKLLLKNPDFYSKITSSTTSQTNLEYRFKKIQKLIDLHTI